MPQKYTLEYLKKNKVAVNCRTLEEAKNVSRILPTYKFTNLETPEILIAKYNGVLCYGFYDIFEICYDTTYWFASEGFQIISASEFLQDWEDESIVSYLSTGHGYIRSVNFEIADQTNDTVTDTNVGEIDNATTIAAIRTHLSEIDNLLKTIK